MEKCNVVLAKLINCSNLTNGCAFLLNENIDGSQLKISLANEKSEYLEMLVNDQAGSAFHSCARHRAIVDTAKSILKERGT